MSPYYQKMTPLERINRIVAKSSLPIEICHDPKKLQMDLCELQTALAIATKRAEDAESDRRIYLNNHDALQADIQQAIKKWMRC